MLQARPGRPGMGSPCPCLPGARAQFVSLAYRRSAPGDLQRYSSKGGGDLLPRSGAPFRKGARPYCPDRDGAARCGAQVPGRKDASHGAGGRSRDRALRFRRGAALQASGSGLRGGARRAGRADRRGSGAGAAQAVKSSRPGICGLLGARLGIVPPSMHREASARLLGSATPTRAHPTAWPGPAPVDGCALR